MVTNLCHCIHHSKLQNDSLVISDFINKNYGSYKIINGYLNMDKFLVYSLDVQVDLNLVFFTVVVVSMYIVAF